MALQILGLRIFVSDVAGLNITDFLRIDAVNGQYLSEMSSEDEGFEKQAKE